MSSYNDLIDAALTAINEHNTAVGGSDKPGYLNPDAFIECVKASGGTSESRLSSLSHEDLFACMSAVSNNGAILPRVLAKEIAEIFRNKKKKEERKPVTTHKAERMTLKELVEAFDPEDRTSPVANRLSQIAQNKKFIVYAEGRKVDVESTLSLLNELKMGYPSRVYFQVGDEIKKVYPVDELPENYVDENPLYSNRPLRPDGTCDQTGRSWEGIPLQIRQFVRLLLLKTFSQSNGGVLPPLTIDNAHNIMDIVMEQNGLSRLRQRYPKVSIEFDELEKNSTLPSLKVVLSSKTRENPFANGRKISH